MPYVFFYPGHFDCLDTLCTMEAAHHLCSTIHVYGGRGGWRRTPLQLILDPSYTVSEPALSQKLIAIADKGWQIGLHPSCLSWKNAKMIQKERGAVEQSLKVSARSCRQHWLRFSWQHTWRVQQEAGLVSDTTLGFNDRPGFRNSAAVAFHPWDFSANAPMKLLARPLVLMDSHLYDYAFYSEPDRAVEIKRWITEIDSVCGSGSLLWHPHTLAADYGWKPGFENLLICLKQTKCNTLQ